jgi:hypothetical protein
MTQTKKDDPLDVTFLQKVASYNPTAAQMQIEEAVAAWEAAGAYVVVGAWKEALQHYEGAMPDKVSHYLAALQLTFEMCGIPVVNHIAVPEIREVNDQGVGPLGDEYDSEAAPDLIAQGLAFNVPVLLRYPDRRLVPGNEVRFADEAVEMLEADLRASISPTTGRLQ